jgi:endonuclease/exonuclease/phosphatase family metal-dependent hydrolase
MNQLPRYLCLAISILFSYSSIGQSLNIVSWNLKDFGQSRDDNEIKLIAKELGNADIVAIQEVVAKHPGGAKAVARLKAQLNRMGAKWDSKISDPTRSPSSQKSERYAYLWKTSKVTITGGRPKLISSLSSKVEREPYQIQFKTKSGEVLTLVNYHACTHKKHNPERAEISAISTWLLSQNYKNVIWCGDMNLVIDDIAFNKILSSGYSSVLNGQKTSLKMECKGGNYLSRAEDNVLYNLSTLAYTYGEVMDFINDGDCGDVSWKRMSYSDHLGIKIEIGL